MPAERANNSITHSEHNFLLKCSRKTLPTHHPQKQGSEPKGLTKMLGTDEAIDIQLQHLAQRGQGRGKQTKRCTKKRTASKTPAGQQGDIDEQIPTHFKENSLCRKVDFLAYVRTHLFEPIPNNQTPGVSVYRRAFCSNATLMVVLHERSFTSDHPLSIKQAGTFYTLCPMSNYIGASQWSQVFIQKDTPREELLRYIGVYKIEESGKTLSRAAWTSLGDDVKTAILNTALKNCEPLFLPDNYQHLLTVRQSLDRGIHEVPGWDLKLCENPYHDRLFQDIWTRT